jgi:hypothetical protein
MPGRNVPERPRGNEPGPSVHVAMTIPNSLLIAAVASLKGLDELWRFHLYYPSRRQVTPALRAFIEVMKSDS